jgi:PAP_fibrillin
MPVTATAVPDGATPTDPQEQRQRLLQLLRLEPRGAANRHSAQINVLITALESARPADLAAPGALAQLEGVWELRWSSSRQPYLAVGPWLENLQCLAPSQGRGMNLLRLSGPLASLAGIAVEASIQLQDSAAGLGLPLQRVAVCFQRGGWLGPRLGGQRLQWLRGVSQSFPAWLEITVLDHELRICRGQAGTLFALLRRTDLSLDQLMLNGPQSHRSSLYRDKL